VSGKRSSGRARRRKGKSQAMPEGRASSGDKEKKGQELPSLKHVREDMRKIGLTAAITTGILVVAAILVRA